MAILLSKIEEMAPDQASLAAASKLRKPASWPVLAAASDGLIWGECQGSGSTPYRVVCSEADLGYKCTCPSRKFPCKHTLALLWMRSEGQPAFTAAQAAPDWVNDWLGRRRPGGGPAHAGRPTSEPAGEKSASAAILAEPETIDPKAEARSAAARDRSRAEREVAIAGGLEELDLWIADALQLGLAGFLANLPARCRTIAQRLVDAKTPGLAARLDALPTETLALPDAQRLDFVMQSLATLYLTAEAYRNQERLPQALREDVRQAVGWPISREALFRDTGALRVRDRWMVVAAVSEVQPDKLRRLETWLSRLGGETGPRFALLLDFVPVSTGAAGSTYSRGEVIEAELVFYPGAAPLRALIAEQAGAPFLLPRWPRPEADVDTAIDSLHAARAARPWLREMPFAAGNARLRQTGETLWLCDAEGETALPVKPDADGLERPLVGLEPIDVFGRWDGNSLQLDLAETPLGRWLGG